MMRMHETEPNVTTIAPTQGRAGRAPRCPPVRCPGARRLRTIPVVRTVPLLLALALAAPASAEAPGPEAGELLDEVVAVVAPGGGRGVRTLITRSDLEVEARVVLVSRGGTEAAARALPDDTLQAVLDWLIAEHLLLAEAEQLEVADVEPALLEREIDAFRARFADEAAFRGFLARHELVDADLARIFRRRLAVDRYVASRLRLAGGVSDADVRRAFEERRASFGDQDWEWVRPRLRAQLERERREALVAALTADLRGRAEVRVLVDLRGGEAKEAPAPDRPWYLRAGEAD